ALKGVRPMLSVSPAPMRFSISRLSSIGLLRSFIDMARHHGSLLCKFVTGQRQVNRRVPFDAIDGSDRDILMRRHDNSPLLSTQKARPLSGRAFLTGQEGAISRRR